MARPAALRATGRASGAVTGWPCRCGRPKRPPLSPAAVPHPQPRMATIRYHEGATRMKPAVGRIVHAFANPTQANGADIAPAIITRVWSDQTVNVTVSLTPRRRSRRPASACTTPARKPRSRRRPCSTAGRPTSAPRQRRECRTVRSGRRVSSTSLATVPPSSVQPQRSPRRLRAPPTTTRGAMVHDPSANSATAADVRQGHRPARAARAPTANSPYLSAGPRASLVCTARLTGAGRNLVNEAGVAGAMG